MARNLKKEYAMHALDTAMRVICEQHPMTVRGVDEYRGVARGIALSAMFLDLISLEEYRTIEQIADNMFEDWRKEWREYE